MGERLAVAPPAEAKANEVRTEPDTKVFRVCTRVCKGTPHCNEPRARGRVAWWQDHIIGVTQERQRRKRTYMAT